jgi:creatinine amidohydrolase/Fe(II)-dependent formamide hydrolase-like protein
VCGGILRRGRRRQKEISAGEAIDRYDGPPGGRIVHTTSHRRPWTLTTLATLVAALAGAMAVPRLASAEVQRVTELTSSEIAALDRTRTVVVLPGGILEEHGPFLPTFTDGYLNERLTESLASAIVAAKPGWTVLVFPTIPLGNSGANDIGKRYTFPGTFAVRFETLRSVYLDLADELGQQGFRWVFVLHLHGAPNHSRALDDAGDYFHDTFGGRMVHLAGLLPVFSTIEGAKSDAAKTADGLPIHSGMDETSWLLHLKPALVRPGYRAARPLADGSMEGLVKIAEAPAWPGYFGAPALATASHGAAIWKAVRSETITLALAILDGADPTTFQRFAQVMDGNPVDVSLDKASLAEEARRAARQEQWLRARGSRR